jgi:YggT family protein
LSRIRKIIPFSLKFGIDISPLIAIIVIVFLQMFLVSSLRDLAMNLK